MLYNKFRQMTFDNIKTKIKNKNILIDKMTKLPFKLYQNIHPIYFISHCSFFFLDLHYETLFPKFKF